MRPPPAQGLGPFSLPALPAARETLGLGGQPDTLGTRRDAARLHSAAGELGLPKILTAFPRGKRRQLSNPDFAVTLQRAFGLVVPANVATGLKVCTCGQVLVGE